MLTDGVKNKEQENAVQVLDVAELVALQLVGSPTSENK
jgi:hypothetical protein